MSTRNTVIINGVHYDAATGIRLEGAPVQPSQQTTKPNAKPATTLHKKTDRTHTLNRAHVKAPQKHVEALHQSVKKAPVAKSPMIRKFADIAPAPKTKSQTLHKAPHVADIAPTRHPIQRRPQPAPAKKTTMNPVSRASKAAVAAPPAAPAPRPAKEVKKQAIEKALHNAKPAKKAKKQAFFKRHPRAMSISSAALALVLLAGYLTYINLPSISVRVAAAQAGIAATYPSYQPSGYSLHGPVAYSNGQVSMNFVANAGSQNYKITQVKSNWDSSALLDNYVSRSSEGDYATFNNNGLTIYVYGTNAAWVNGGILHTIQGNAPLTTSQIQRIAASM